MIAPFTKRIVRETGQRRRFSSRILRVWALVDSIHLKCVWTRRNSVCW